MILDQRRELASLVIEARARSGLSQEGLALKAGLNVQSVYRLERRLDLNPAPDTIIKICDVLHVDYKPFLVPAEME